jgi:hypothetical protein
MRDKRLGSHGNITKNPSLLNASEIMNEIKKILMKEREPLMPIAVNVGARSWRYSMNQ